ncbi:MAG: M15 family metallopeptidase [Bacteroidota bacterium]
MLRAFFTFFSAGILLTACSDDNNTSSNDYSDSLDIVDDIEEHQEQVANNPNLEVIDLSEIHPEIEFDIRYATENNFTGEIIYPSADAFARKPVAEALVEVQDSLSQLDLKLKIFDGYRPYQATVMFYDIYPNSDFVANPEFGSRHNRGCAIDLTLIDKNTNEELDMPTGYDDFTEVAHPDYTDLPEDVIENRELLIGIMTHFGFSVYPSEWWHFDYDGWEDYPLMDLSFSELKEIQ